MVTTWAGKEMRNLMRMKQAGLPVPKAHLLKGHVLVMDFIGMDGWAAPLLKNAEISQSEAGVLYLRLGKYMRTTYRYCRLVHAELSEYNMILYDGQIYIIDVSQSVEHDHPHSLELLRSNCANVTKFFKSKGGDFSGDSELKLVDRARHPFKKRFALKAVMSVRDLFQVIADPLVKTQIQVDEFLSRRSVEAISDDALFMNAYIAHKLHHVLHFERDARIAAEGGEVPNRFQTMLAKVEHQPTTDSVCEASASESDGGGSVEDDVSQRDPNCGKACKKEDEEAKAKRILLHTRLRDESPASKKERKRLVKEEQRQNRLTKTPKYIKRRHDKAGKKH